MNHQILDVLCCIERDISQIRVPRQDEIEAIITVALGNKVTQIPDCPSVSLSFCHLDISMRLSTQDLRQQSSYLSYQHRLVSDDCRHPYLYELWHSNAATGGETKAIGLHMVSVISGPFTSSLVVDVGPFACVAK